MYVYMCVWMDGRVDGRVDGWMDRGHMVNYIYRAEHRWGLFLSKCVRIQGLEHVLSLRIPFYLIIGIPRVPHLGFDRRSLTTFWDFVTGLYRRLPGIGMRCMYSDGR